MARPPVYKKDSDRFTVSPAQFTIWLQYLLFSKDEETATIDLESDELNEVAKNMQQQIKEGENNGKKKSK